MCWNCGKPWSAVWDTIALGVSPTVAMRADTPRATQLAGTLETREPAVPATTIDDIALYLPYWSGQ